MVNEESKIMAHAALMEVPEEAVGSAGAKRGLLDGVINGFAKSAKIESRKEETVGGEQVVKVKARASAGEDKPEKTSLLLCTVKDGKLLLLTITPEDGALQWDSPDVGYPIERRELPY